MAENIFICKHQMGAGWCEIHDDYCVEGPCGDMDTTEYAPVVHGRWETRKIIDGFPAQYHHFHNAPNCKYGYGDYNCVGHSYCPNCGTRMDGETK